MLPHPILATLVAFSTTASAHTSFTTLLINGVNQGDGTCVRQPAVPQTATFPITDLASPDMICGRNGLVPVPFTCAAPAGATLTFEFREYPSGSQAGAIDPSHKGPCAVYLKPVASMDTATTAPAAGWFKIWDEGYDSHAEKWCTEKLIAANGLLSVALPRGLPAGGYLVRPELLALHEAQVGNPQFYVGCAQIFVAGNPLSADLAVPDAYAATLPGYVHAGEPSVSFDVYDQPPASYPLPGPPVFVPGTAKAAMAASSATGKLNLTSADLAVAREAGIAFVPGSCLVKNANWCGVEVPAYTTETGCWNASADCFRQEQACYAAAPPTGHANCDVWDGKCTGIQAACMAGNFVGPPQANRKLQQVEAAVPGPIPQAAVAGRQGRRSSRLRYGRRGD